jgi:hypothetical protein
MNAPAVHPLRNRQGTILIVTLTVMSVMLALAAAMLRGTQLSRRQFRTELHVRQADQLLHAAIELTGNQLVNNRPMSEQQIVSSKDIVGLHEASLMVTASPREAGGWLIKAVVEYPFGGLHPVRRRRTKVFLKTDQPQPPVPSSFKPTSSQEPT